MSAKSVKEKNLQVLNRWWKKISFLLEITIPVGENNDLCLSILLMIDRRHVIMLVTKNRQKLSCYCSRPCYLFKPSYLGSFAAFAPRHLGLSQGNLV